MPFKSKAQMRRFFAMEEKGDIPKGTAEKWLKETKDVSKLPERIIKKQASFFGKIYNQLFAK